MTQIMEAPKKGVVNCGVKSALFGGERGKSCVSVVCVLPAEGLRVDLFNGPAT